MCEPYDFDKAFQLHKLQSVRISCRDIVNYVLYYSMHYVLLTEP